MSDRTSTAELISEVDAHLENAHLPTLLMSVAHLTSDLSVLRKSWRPDVSVGLVDGNYTDQQKGEIFDFCRERLIKVDTFDVPPPSYDFLLACGQWIMGSDIDPYAPILPERLLFGGQDPQKPKWSKSKLDVDRKFSAAVIGAGESGLLMAYRLKQAGIDYTLFDKNEGVGGTWWANRYPGARVDVNSFLYSYSFAQKVWSGYFAPRDEILEYLKQFADDNGLNENIELGTEVKRCAWNDETRLWDLTVSDGEGERSLSVNTVISAVGQLANPKMPDIDGIDTFAGDVVHSAAWPKDTEVKGKRIGVIGNGATAMQLVPELAKTADEVVVFSRTPTWLLPRPWLHQEIEGSTRWLMENFPSYANWYRAYEFIPQIVGFLNLAEVDETYPPSELAVSKDNEDFRKVMTEYIERQIIDRPDLKRHVLPNTPFAAKRFVCDNGSWISALKQDNVKIVSDPLSSMTQTAAQCADGSSYDLDLMVCATGFEASKFLMPMEVTGRGGLNLREEWKDDARAYLGITIPDMPNFFCMYGPNSNFLVHGASIFHLSESVSAYVMDALKLILVSGVDDLTVKSEVNDEYNKRLDHTSSLMTWGWSSVSSWYKNSSGRVTQNYPFSMVEFYQRTHTVNQDDYEFS